MTLYFHAYPFKPAPMMALSLVSALMGHTKIWTRPVTVIVINQSIKLGDRDALLCRAHHADSRSQIQDQASHCYLLY